MVLKVKSLQPQDVLQDADPSNAVTKDPQSEVTMATRLLWLQGYHGYKVAMVTRRLAGVPQQRVSCCVHQMLEHYKVPTMCDRESEV